MRRPRGGLVDALLVAVLAYAVYARTPLGAIGETALRVARGQEDHPSWLATFRGHETEVALDGATLAAQEPTLEASLALAAATHGVDTDTLAALFATQGTCTQGRCALVAPPHTGAAIASLAGLERLSPDDSARALAASARALDGDMELAVEALWLGPIAVRRAVALARRSGLANPTDIEVHAAFLAPSARRGPLQPALATLAVRRLRTLVWPAPTDVAISSPFGERIHPVTGKRSLHNGTDIATPVGTPLIAAHHGSVKRAGEDSLSGAYVVLDHGLGIETSYCHLSEALVDDGARVRQRDRIALSGATGRVTGPHLHYVLRVRGAPTDPERHGGAPARAASGPPAISPPTSL